MRRLVPRGLRHRVMAVVLLGAVLGLAALTAGFNLVLSGRLDADANSVLRARTAAQLATLAAPGGRLQVREAPDDAAADSQVWIYAGSRLLERPRTNRRDQRAVGRVSMGSWPASRAAKSNRLSINFSCVTPLS